MDQLGYIQTQGQQAARTRTLATIVVPCFNEADGTESLYQALENLERTIGDRYQLEFLLIDDASTDDTYQLLKDGVDSRANYRVFRNEQNLGVAGTIMRGIRLSNSEVVGSMDSDCTYDPQQFAEMLPLMRDGVDLVTASPYHPQGLVRNVPAWRLWISRVASSLYRSVFNRKLYTYTSCFRVYRRSAVADVELDSTGFVGIAELLWRLDRKGCNIVECPAELGVRQAGQSKMRVVSASLQHLRFLSYASWQRVSDAVLYRLRVS